MSAIDMMIKALRAVFLIGLCIGWGYLSAQTVLPNWVVDSLLYETFKGRECNNLQEQRAKVIAKLGAELIANSAALKLSTTQIGTAKAMEYNMKSQKDSQSERFSNKEKESKKKLRKRAVIILGQAVIIVLLII